MESLSRVLQGLNETHSLKKLKNVPCFRQIFVVYVFGAGQKLFANCSQGADKMAEK
jgi:hypothetical protein